METESQHAGEGGGLMILQPTVPLTAPRGDLLRITQQTSGKAGAGLHHATSPPLSCLPLERMALGVFPKCTMRREPWPNVVASPAGHVSRSQSQGVGFEKSCKALHKLA